MPAGRQVRRLVALLDGPLPAVPRDGHGEAGDISALAHLFRPAFEGTLELGEGMALINGSPRDRRIGGCRP
jgi:histidine ammonia-lyase